MNIFDVLCLVTGFISAGVTAYLKEKGKKTALVALLLERADSILCERNPVEILVEAQQNSVGGLIELAKDQIKPFVKTISDNDLFRAAEEAKNVFDPEITLKKSKKRNLSD